MDTWATSSLTPQIAGHWEDDPDLFDRVFPMDLRPQGPEIIRTWLFATMLRAHLEHDSAPWERTSINGWILDPDRKKMSKSKDNVVTPLPLIEEHGAEAIRYWACKGRPGADTAVDFGVMKIGRRLAIKVLNASRFVLNFGGSDNPDDITEPLDRAMLASLQATVEQATAAFEAFDYARALEVAERSFWRWTDDYLELVKTRAYGDSASSKSAHAALRLALSVYLRLLAPTLPFVCEEVWSWWREGSVHRAGWPRKAELAAVAGDASVLDVTADVLSEVRGAKSTAKVSMRTEVDLLVVKGPQSRLALVKEADSDLRDAARASVVEYVEGEPGFIVKLAVD
jgi:valyl-tRNA synthetase